MKPDFQPPSTWRNTPINITLQRQNKLTRLLQKVHSSTSAAEPATTLKTSSFPDAPGPSALKPMKERPGAVLATPSNTRLTAFESAPMLTCTRANRKTRRLATGARRFASHWVKVPFVGVDQGRLGSRSCFPPTRGNGGILHPV